MLNTLCFGNSKGAPAAWPEMDGPNWTTAVPPPAGGESQVGKVLEKWEGPHNSAPSVLKFLKKKATLLSQI